MQFDEASAALVELAASRHNAFHTNEAADIGLNSQRLRRARKRGEIHQLAPRVWALRSLPTSDLQSLRAAVISLPRSAAMASSAAWLHGWLDVAPRLPQVWAPANSARRGPSATIHQRSGVDPLRDITVVNHIRCLNKAATLCLLGRTLPPQVVEKCLDDFLRTESNGWLAETMERLWSRQCRGCRTLTGILRDPRRVAGVTDSWMERVVAQLVAIPWMPPLALQHELVVEGRRFRIDIACPDLKLGVEAHSRTFHFGPSKEDADNVRDLLVSSIGWTLLYVTYSQLSEPGEFVRLFSLNAKARALQLGVDLGRGAASAA